MLTYVHYIRLVDLLYNLIYTEMQTKPETKLQLGPKSRGISSDA